MPWRSLGRAGAKVPTRARLPVLAPATCAVCAASAGDSGGAGIRASMTSSALRAVPLAGVLLPSVAARSGGKANTWQAWIARVSATYSTRKRSSCKSSSSASRAAGEKLTLRRSARRVVDRCSFASPRSPWFHTSGRNTIGNSSPLLAWMVSSCTRRCIALDAHWRRGGLGVAGAFLAHLGSSHARGLRPVARFLRGSAIRPGGAGRSSTRSPSGVPATWREWPATPRSAPGRRGCAPARATPEALRLALDASRPARRGTFQLAPSRRVASRRARPESRRGAHGIQDQPQLARDSRRRRCCRAPPPTQGTPRATSRVRSARSVVGRQQHRDVPGLTAATDPVARVVEQPRCGWRNRPAPAVAALGCPVGASPQETDGSSGCAHGSSSTAYGSRPGVAWPARPAGMGLRLAKPLLGVAVPRVQRGSTRARMERWLVPSDKRWLRPVRWRAGRRAMSPPRKL